MSKIAEVMTTEIGRLARKEIKKALEPLSGELQKVKRRVSQMSKTLADLERQTASKQKVAQAKQAAPAPASPDESKGARLSPLLIKKLRKRLKISQTELAVLVGVSQPAVASWEQGRAKPRGHSRDVIIGLRNLNARSVRELLKA